MFQNCVNSTNITANYYPACIRCHGRQARKCYWNKKISLILQSLSLRTRKPKLLVTFEAFSAVTSAVFSVILYSKCHTCLYSHRQSSRFTPSYFISNYNLCWGNIYRAYCWKKSSSHLHVPYPIGGCEEFIILKICS